MGDAEDIYREAVERLDEDFLEKRKKVKDSEGLEKEYTSKLKSLREKYVKDSYSFIKNQKNTSSLDISLLDQKNFTQFKSSRVTMDFSVSEKKKIQKEIENFKLKRKRREFFFKIVPPFIIYSYYFIILKASILIASFNDFIFNCRFFIKDSFSNLVESIKDLSKKAFNYFISKVNLIYSFIKEKVSKLTKKKEVTSPSEIAASQDPAETPSSDS